MPSKAFKVTDIKSNELDRLVEIVSDALIIPEKERKEVKEFLKERGIENLRGVRDGTKLIGGLQLLHWGHFFGGKSIRAAGVSFVGILPEYRRVGAASHLMNESVKELYRGGIPLSTLLPANVPLYRKSGYELAMELCRVKIKLRDIKIRNMELDVVPFTAKDIKPLKEMYHRFASGTNGNIDRNPMVWEKIIEPWGKVKASKYLLKRGRETEGYFICSTNYEKQRFFMRDSVFFTRRAAERALTFFADHSSVGKYLTFLGSRLDPLVFLLPDTVKVSKEPYFCMLRIVSVKDALKARGYPEGVDAELHFDAVDDLIKQNNGRFILKVKNGKGSVSNGGNGKIKIDIRTLAQMYSGVLSPEELKIAGKLDASDTELAKAMPVFAGPHPWIRDPF